MKKVIILLCLFFMSFGGFAQSTSNVPPRYYVNPTAAFQLFPTENRWIFIKLNTQTGQMWMVQYAVDNASDAFSYPMNSSSLLKNNEERINGRYTLYPTQNHYNFILLDQISGRTWQVQWSTDASKIGIWEIK